jgi:hypothetical protein
MFEEAICTEDKAKESYISKSFMVLTSCQVLLKMLKSQSLRYMEHVESMGENILVE